jgi:hypothetical protein
MGLTVKYGLLKNAATFSFLFFMKKKETKKAIPKRNTARFGMQQCWAFVQSKLSIYYSGSYIFLLALLDLLLSEI